MPADAAALSSRAKAERSQFRPMSLIPALKSSISLPPSDKSWERICRTASGIRRITKQGLGPVSPHGSYAFVLAVMQHGPAPTLRGESLATGRRAIMHLHRRKPSDALRPVAVRSILFVGFALVAIRSGKAADRPESIREAFFPTHVRPLFGLFQSWRV